VSTLLLARKRVSTGRSTPHPQEGGVVESINRYVLRPRYRCRCWTPRCTHPWPSGAKRACLPLRPQTSRTIRLHAGRSGDAAVLLWALPIAMSTMGRFHSAARARRHCWHRNQVPCPYTTYVMSAKLQNSRSGQEQTGQGPGGFGGQIAMHPLSIHSSPLFMTSV
jgi:hypothetical protein